MNATLTKPAKTTTTTATRTTTEILEVLKATVTTLETEHTKTTKVARGRARSAANELKTLAAEFKRNSLVEDKTK